MIILGAFHGTCGHYHGKAFPASGLDVVSIRTASSCGKRHRNRLFVRQIGAIAFDGAERRAANATRSSNDRRMRASVRNPSNQDVKKGAIDHGDAEKVLE